MSACLRARLGHTASMVRSQSQSGTRTPAISVTGCRVRYTHSQEFTWRKLGMKITATIVTMILVLFCASPMAQTADLEARINELEAAFDYLQERIEKLERQQTPRRMSEAEAAAVLRKKQADDACTEQLGPAPEFAPVLGTKVNPAFMAYMKEHRACVREKGVQ